MIDRSDLVKFELADGTVVAGSFSPFLDAPNTKLVVAALDAGKLSWFGLLHTDDAVGMRRASFGFSLRAAFRVGFY